MGLDSKEEIEEITSKYLAQWIPVLGFSTFPKGYIVAKNVDREAEGQILKYFNVTYGTLGMVLFFKVDKYPEYAEYFWDTQFVKYDKKVC